MKARLEREIPGTRSKLKVSVQEKSRRIQPKSKWAKKTPKRTTYEATKTKQKEKLKRLLWKKRSSKVERH